MMYFFLSYAHSVPVSSPPVQDSDFWVRKFFDDLSAAVDSRAGRPDGMEPGFFDGLLDPGADLRRELTEALSMAQVFVPLYSPNYFGNAWAVGERASFQSRLTRLAPAAAARHVVPVLWIPLQPWDTRPEIDEALGLVGKSAEYAENGLRALCKLAIYRESYAELVGALADRIVAVVRESPLPRSPAAPLNAHPVRSADAALVVTALSARAGAHDWKPFAGEHKLAVADYVAATAERLGLPTQVVEPDEARRLAEHRPCIMLIDGSSSPFAVRAAIRELPRWVVPLVVVAGARGDRDNPGLDGILRDAEFPEVDPVFGVEEFERSAPLLVTEARKQYLRYGPVDAPAEGGTPRRTLRENVD